MPICVEELFSVSMTVPVASMGCLHLAPSNEKLQKHCEMQVLRILTIRDNPWIKLVRVQQVVVPERFNTTMDTSECLKMLTISLNGVQESAALPVLMFLCCFCLLWKIMY